MLSTKFRSVIYLLIFRIRRLFGPRGARPTGYLWITDSRTSRQYEVPIHDNAVNALQFTQIRASDQTGLRLFDQGFQNTAVMKSNITHVDGFKGTIHYREQSISELVGNMKFEDVTFLLIWGHLPSLDERKAYKEQLAAAMIAPQVVQDVLQAFPPSAPMLTMITAGLSAWCSADPTMIPASMGKNLYQGNLDEVDKKIIQVLSALGAVVAMSYCRLTEGNFTAPDPDSSFIENMLIMMSYVDDNGKPNPKHVDCLERLWVLYADHELTNSTAAFLHVASTLADPFSCSIASILAAYGPLHGGAIETAFKTIERVGKPANVPELIEDVKKKRFRLFGYGHRIYKTVDPRSVFIRELLSELTNTSAEENNFLSIALEIDRIASQDEYFTSRKLKANADLYGSFVYMALGFPAEIILPLTMVSRCPGVMAHWREAMSQPARIWRPQQVYTGNPGGNT